MKSPDSFPVTIKKGNSIVKIYRHKNGEYHEFKVAYYLAGKRKMETFSDYDRAKDRAGEINGSVTDGNLDGIALSKEECILFQRAKSALAACAVPVDQAAREYAAAIKLIGDASLVEAAKDYARRHPSNLKKVPVPELYEQLLKDKRTDGASDVYLKDLTLRLGKFADAFHVNVLDLSAETINEFLRELKSGGRSRNNYRRSIGTFIKYAETKNALPKGQITLKDLARAKEAAFDVEIFTPAEMVKLLNAAQPNFAEMKPGYNRRYATGPGLLPFLLLGGFAGMRNAEITRQKWSDINLERGFIRVTAAKGNTAQKRLIPIHDNLRQWLLTCWQNEGLCCGRKRPVDALMRLAKRAKVEWRHNAPRHSFGSYRSAETQNIPQVAMEMGNSVKMVNRHYREAVEPEQAKAWFSIEPQKAANVVPMSVALAG